MNEIDLKKIEDDLEGISSWPWEGDKYSKETILFAFDNNGDGDPEFLGHVESADKNDADFIIKSPERISNLIKELRKARGVIEHYAYADISYDARRKAMEYLNEVKKDKC